MKLVVLLFEFDKTDSKSLPRVLGVCVGVCVGDWQEQEAVALCRFQRGGTIIAKIMIGKPENVPLFFSTTTKILHSHFTNIIIHLYQSQCTSPAGKVIYMHSLYLNANSIVLT
jgi:hypothetical protein